ncbi:MULTISPECIES: primosome assembly protein PriA [unclassified Ornithinimicrobium]|uniref:primosomal protein N' family DNA-binding protein n=1 Tax=unclassified Ornithinimicrobium TaxID=2615080 RepID=UPI003852E8AD
MSEQLSLVPVPSPARRRPRTTPVSDTPLAEVDPVATVLVDTPLPHLDRPFEYLVPAELSGTARPGARVKVRFSGRDHDGYVLERRAGAEHTGRLTQLRRVVSPESVLTPHVALAARAVADHYGGTLADVVRLAVPHRHARAERTVPEAARTVLDAAGPDPPVPPTPGDGPAEPAWAAYPAGGALLRRLGAGLAPAAAWLALPGAPPGQDWPAALAAAVAATRRSGRGAVVVVPDHRDVARLLPALEEVLEEGDCVQLTADLGPEARYRAFLRVLRGHARVVVGTRSAAWAPVADLGLLVCWDDGDDLHHEPRTPYPHVREVLRVRAGVEEAGLLIGGPARSVELQAWVRDGTVADVLPERAALRALTPAVVVAGEGHQEDRDPGARTARIPSVAWRALRDGLEHGPVLVQVPRHGYVVSLACQDCRVPVRCPRCEGPVGLPVEGATPACRWCGTPAAPGQHCRSCGSARLRSVAVGELRTAEELGRAFPRARVISSGGAQVVAEVGPEPALVVATPGAEPWAREGYRAVALLDGWRLLDRASLDAGIEALRRWTLAATQARPQRSVDRTTDSGAPAPKVVLCGVPPHGGVPAVEALVRWDPVWLAQRELDERAGLDLPPVRRHVAVQGPARGVQEVVLALAQKGHLQLADALDLGSGQARSLVRESVEGGLATAVREVRAGRGARKAEDAVRTVLDPADGLL